MALLIYFFVISDLVVLLFNQKNFILLPSLLHLMRTFYLSMLKLMDLLHGDLETSEYNSLFVLEIFVRAFCASVIPIELSRLQKRKRVKLVETRFFVI